MAIAGDLIFKIVGGFAVDGLRRTYQEVRAGTRRRQTLDKVLSGNTQTDDGRLKRAFDDLNILIGNGRGELTESVAAFLREIERSAIPEAITRCVLTNADPQTIYPAFEVIYGSFTGTLPFPCNRFFDAFYAAIKLSIEAEVKDPALLEFIQTQHIEFSKQLAGVAKALAASGQGTILEFEEVLAARARLARSLEVANRYLSVETVKGVKRCRIRQLVVPPRLATSPAPKIETKKAKSQLENMEYVSYVTFKATARRAVILGDPGGGKSTLTQLLCFDNSNSILLESNYPGKPQIDPTSLRIPFRIILRSFDKRRQSTASHGLFDHLVDQLKEVFDNDTSYTTTILKHFLTVGNAVLIFDGLDEILEVERRREIVALIEQFTTVYAACQIIITSRLVGYQDAPMNEEYSIYYLSTFNDEEIEGFTQKFIKFVEGIKRPIAQEKANKFLAQTNNIAADLRENPLMLGLMVYLFVYRGDVPANRPEIYKECATLMFERWDQRRDIIFKIPVDFDLLDLFSYLASKIFGSADTEDGVSRDWITRELRAFFESWYLDRAKASHATKSLVEFITGRAWVMFEVGPSVYKFTHRTFLEYFFARNLISSSVSISSLIRDHLLQKILRFEWDVVCHLAIQTAVFRDSGKMAQAADTIISIVDEGSMAPHEEIALLLFIASALEYLLLPETKHCEIVARICERAIQIGGGTGAASNAVVNLLIRNTRKREDLAKNVVYRLFRNAIKTQGSPERSFALFAIAKNPHHRGFHYYGQINATGRSGVPGWLLARVNGDYFSELRKETEALNYSLALKDPLEARSYIFSYGAKQLELFHQHRWQAFVGENKHRTLDDFPSLLLETFELYVLADGFRESMIVTEDTANSDVTWRLIDEMVADILNGRGPAGPLFNSSHHLELDAKMHEIVRRIYMRLTTQKWKSDNDRYIKLFYLAAYTIEDFERISSGKSSQRKIKRFDNYAPAGVVERIFVAIADHPLAPVLREWNNRQLQLAR